VAVAVQDRAEAQVVWALDSWRSFNAGSIPARALKSCAYREVNPRQTVSVGTVRSTRSLRHHARHLPRVQRFGSHRAGADCVQRALTTVSMSENSDEDTSLFPYRCSSARCSDGCGGSRAM
jgi:hypothetical protein